MARKSWLPEGGGNLFQKIKAMCAEAEARGQKLYRLSIGQPMGPALESARLVASAAILEETQRMHEYQDNGSPGCPDFAKRFVQAHLPVDTVLNNVAFLPTPGTKPMLLSVIAACDAVELGEKLHVKTHTKPGYPTPMVWAGYWGARHSSLPTNPENGFLFGPKDIYNPVSRSSDRTLNMVNFPHNPTGVIATKEWWREICAHCQKHSIRLFNDAAYAALAWDLQSCLLAEVAGEFPDLSWLEAYSASKVLGNACGWRIGALVGSPDFIDDIARIKGETDSGFNAALACGVLHAMENDQENIKAICEMYQRRMEKLISVLQGAGMRLVVEPQAGFFSLWGTPRQVFGQEVKDAEHFNQLMIQNTGIVGVHFPPYMRYSTCAPLEDPDFAEAVQTGFARADVRYI